MKSCNRHGPFPTIRALGLLSMLAVTPIASAQPTAWPSPADTQVARVGDRAFANSADSTVRVRRVPGSGHGAGGVRRLLYGRQYSKLWITPVQVELLDLNAFAGGLAPMPASAESPPGSLRLRAADGCVYVFRPLDPGRPSRRSFRQRIPVVRGFLPDALASEHPAAALVCAALLQAVGVLHPHPRLVALPADTSLEAAHPGFAGRLGILEESLDPDSAIPCGFPGTVAIATTAEVLDRVAAGQGDRVDSRAYLAARLADFILGDFDRDPAAWRWAAFSDGPARTWRPVSLVAGRSLARADRQEGLIHTYARASALQSPAGRPEPGDGGPDDFSAGRRHEQLDRRLLSGLTRQDWDSVASALVARLSDSTLAAVVDAMPREMRPLSAWDLFRSLARNREAMPAFATSLYRRLSEAVDLWTSDAPESVEVCSPDDRHVRVAVFARQDPGSDDPPPSFERCFDAQETREIRLYLRGGGDHVVVRGPGRSDVTLRIIGSGRGDELIDSTTSGDVCLYDSAVQTVVGGSGSVRTDRRPYPVFADTGRIARAWAPTRDYGRSRLLSLWRSSERFTGFFVGAQYSLERFGFRQPRYATRTELRAGVSLTLGGYELQASHEVRRANSGLSGKLLARASTLSVTSFYGFGNETPDSMHQTRGSFDYYNVREVRYQVQPTVSLQASRSVALTVGVPLTLVRARESSSGDFIRNLRPYGWGSYAELGGQAGIRFGEPRLSSRGYAAIARGPQFDLLGSYYPGMWGIETGFGSLEGTASLGLGAATPTEPAVAMHLGGKQLWGRYPFDEAAMLGGRATLLGFAEQRYAGDASLYGGSEVNVRVARLRRLVPGYFGVLGLVETGRVFLAGENSTHWHSASGAGVWFAGHATRERLSLTYVRGEDRSGVYARGTLGF